MEQIINQTDILYYKNPYYKIKLDRNRFGDYIFEVLDDENHLTIQLSENQLMYLKERCDQLLDE